MLASCFQEVAFAIPSHSMAIGHGMLVPAHVHYLVVLLFFIYRKLEDCTCTILIMNFVSTINFSSKRCVLL